MGSVTLCLLFIAINLLIGKPLVRHWQWFRSELPQDNPKHWHVVFTCVRLLVVTSAWLLLMLMTINMLFSALGSGPEPYILLPWAIFAMIYGVCFIFVPKHERQNSRHQYKLNDHEPSGSDTLE